MSEQLEILLCEPDEAEAAKVIAHLTSRAFPGTVTRIAQVSGVAAALSVGKWNLILCAHSQPDFDARQILNLAQAADPDLPMIVLSSTAGEASVAELMIAGARDVVRKSDLTRLVPVIYREIQTTHLRRNLLQAADRAEVRFRNIVETSLQGIIVRANSTTQFVNSAFCKMFGYSHEEMMNLQSMTELHPESEHSRIRSHVTSRYGGDMSIYEYEIEGVRKDGSIFWCSKMASHVEWDGQLAVQVTVVDITERKKAEQQLAERERQYRETFENAPVAMIRSGYDRKIIDANTAFADMLGYSKEEVIGLRAGDFVPERERDAIVPTIKRVWTREIEGAEAEHRMIRKDGSPIWVRSSSRLTGDSDDGHSVQMLAQFQDITRRREAEVALTERETIYRNLVEKSLQGLLIIDHKGRALFANDVFANMMGYTADELVAMDDTFRLYHTEEQAVLRQRMQMRRTGDQATARYEIQAIRKDGTQIWLEQLTAAIEWNGEPAIQIAIIDITDRQRDAELLEARELKYRQTFENAPVAMFRISRNRTLLDVNQAFKDLIGYTGEELIEKTGFSLIHPDDRAQVLDRTRRVWSQEIELAQNEYRMRRQDGQEIWVATSGRLTPDEAGELNHMIVQLQDITARKTAEEQLRLAQQSLALSEKQYRELFDDAPVAMSWVGPDGRYVRTNRALQTLFGYSADELQQLHPLQTVHPDYQERAHESFGKLIRGEMETAQSETLHIRKDGRTIWVAVTVRVMRDENGAPRHVLAHLQDVTARKMAEEERDSALRSLAQNERQYRELFEHAPVAIAALSLNGDFLQTNAAHNEMLGYTKDEMMSMHPLDRVEASQRDAVRQMLANAAERMGHGRVNHDIPLIHKDGTPVWVWLSGTIVFDEDEKPSYMLAHLQDITARKKAEAQLFQSQKMEALGNLAGGIAHDFNNMLLPIIGLTALSKEDIPFDSPVQENLDTVIEAAEKARRLVSQILAFSRQDQSEAASVDISSCLQEAVGLVRNVLPSSITVIDHVQNDIGTVLADTAQIHSIILNLGSNAAHAMDNKVGELEIGLSAIVADAQLVEMVGGLANGTRYARITVRDTGCGMDKDTLNKIFNPFFTTKPVGEGTGLGLSMVHGIVEGFDGAIHVSSEIGVGTRFDIYLPLQQTQQELNAFVALARSA